MGNFIETDAGEAFIASGDSRQTAPEIMRAIAFFARDEAEAESLWEGTGIGSIANLTDIWEHATGNGRIDGDDLQWGDRTLSEIMAEESDHDCN